MISSVRAGTWHPDPHDSMIMSCLPAGNATHDDKVALLRCPSCFGSMQIYSCMHESLKHAHLQHGNGSGHCLHAIKARLQCRHAGAARLPQRCAHATGTNDNLRSILSQTRALLCRDLRICESAALRKHSHGLTLAILRLKLPGVEAGAHVNGYKHEKGRCIRR